MIIFAVLYQGITNKPRYTIMRKLSYSLLLVLSLFAVLSCEKQSKQNPQEEDEYVSVRFNVSYENVGFVSDEPLSKAVEPNALYGICVREYQEGHENDIHNSDKYCFGLYDDISQLVIQFKRNRKYFIRMRYFPNGKNELPYRDNSFSPLQVNPWHLVEQIPALNTITYSSSLDLAYIADGTKQPYDSYMYWNESFIPVDNTPLPVRFLRMNAGLTFKLEKVDGFDYNVVQVRDCNWDIVYSANVANGDTQIVIEKLSLGYSTWGEGGLPELYNNEFEIGTPDNPSLFFKGVLQLKRNTMRTYSVKMESDITINAMSISYEDGTFNEDNGGLIN